jgi:hypothetical protein
MNAAYDEPDVHLLVGGYALDALGPEQTAHFEAHLVGCPSCRNEVVSLRAAAAELGASEVASPPAGLRAAVLATVARTPQLPPTAGDQALPVAAPIDAVTADRASGSTPMTDPSGKDAVTGESSDGVAVGDTLVRLPRRTAPHRVLAVAAGVLLLLAGALGWRSAALSHDLDQVQANAVAVTSVLTAPDAVAATGPVAGGGRGAVVTSISLDHAIIVTNGVPALPHDKVYQLWFISASGSATPAGFLTPDASGQGTQVLTGTVGSAALVGVTVEPSGGSLAPTTTPVLALKI